MRGGTEANDQQHIRKIDQPPNSAVRSLNVMKSSKSKLTRYTVQFESKSRGLKQNVTRSNLRKHACAISRQNSIGPFLSETGQDVCLLGRLKGFENGSRFVSHMVTTLSPQETFVSILVAIFMEIYSPNLVRMLTCTEVWIRPASCCDSSEEGRMSDP